MQILILIILPVCFLVKKVTPNAVTLDTEPDVEYELFDVEDEKYYRGNCLLLHWHPLSGWNIPKSLYIFTKFPC